MPEWSSLLLYMSAFLILLLTPGPAVLYIVARSIDQGRIAGVVSALGVGVGTLVHVAAAALGLSTLLVSSSAAFGIAKYIGAAYLVYLGARKLFERPRAEPPAGAPLRRPAGAEAPTAVRLPRVFLQGIVVNILNPKLALFFFAFLPQFVDPSRGPAAAQSLFLGGLFVAMAVCSDSVYALLAGTAGRFLKGNPVFLKAQRYVVGGIYVALGVAAALFGHPGKHAS
jgi:threonine/homoserine/homoserine lactone efflux protein